MTAPPPLVSLIVATVDRVELVGELLASLVTQTLQDFEVVVVDQNRDDRLVALLAHYERRLAITHIRRAARAVAQPQCGTRHRARHDGCIPRRRLPLQAGYACARRRLLACATANADGVTGRAVAAPGERAPARFARDAHWLSRRSVFVGGMSCVIFMRMQLCARIGTFDEHLGLGRRRRGRPPRNPTTSRVRSPPARASAAGARRRIGVRAAR